MNAMTRAGEGTAFSLESIVDVGACQRVVRDLARPDGVACDLRRLHRVRLDLRRAHGVLLDESTLSLPDGGGGGGGGGGLVFQSFTGTLGPNETLTKSVGNFTLTTATNAAGTCGAINLRAGDLDSQRSVNNGAFANLPPNTTAAITAANTSVDFAGVSDNGTSSVTGQVGRAQQGGTCLLTGYFTGN